MPKTHLSQRKPVQNRILAALPPRELDNIRPHLELVPLEFKEVLYGPERPIQFGYFIEAGLISRLVVMQNGECVEVAVVGKEGFAGTPLLCATRRTTIQTRVQTTGIAFRIKWDVLEHALPENPVLQLMLRRFMQAESDQLSQISACNRLHAVGQRLSRWMLMASDRVGSVLPFTHDFIADTLGSRRSTVTIATSALKRVGLIDYDRGRIEIVDRQALELAACECYAVIRGELASAMKT